MSSPPANPPPPVPQMRPLSDYALCDGCVPFLLEYNRIKHGWSAHATSDRIGIEGITPEDVASYERGAAIPSKQVFERIIQCFEGGGD